MPDAPSLDDLLRHHLASVGLPRRGKVMLVEVMHDDKCAFFHGAECNCVPDVASGAMIDRKYGVQP